jgi:subtilisin family serine protease
VGNTDINDEVAASSSRGTSTAGLQKPQVSAPGTNIVSAGISASNSYRILSGTSMATPHVVGAIALMKSANPSITEDQVRQLLQTTSVRPNVASSDLACDQPADGKSYFYHNAAFEFGRVNVKAAMGL